jgi:hypothetical protein
MIGFTIEAVDGHSGRCMDFLLDDRFWKVRYVVVDALSLAGERGVILPPTVIGTPVCDRRVLPVQLTRRQIEGSPPLAGRPPVSQQHDARLRNRHRPGDDRPRAARQTVRTSAEHHAVSSVVTPVEERHLRSACEVVGYQVRAADREIGRVDDLIVDDGPWLVRYLAVATGAWLEGRPVLVAKEWFGGVDRTSATVEVSLTAEAIATSPEYDPRVPPSRDLERRLYGHLGRLPYWEI